MLFFKVGLIRGTILETCGNNFDSFFCLIGIISPNVCSKCLISNKINDIINKTFVVAKNIPNNLFNNPNCHEFANLLIKKPEIFNAKKTTKNIIKNDIIEIDEVKKKLEK